jgi:signal transduction histidine kinase/putative methionine-R-sulfoxide reductase with GAF domain
MQDKLAELYKKNKMKSELIDHRLESLEEELRYQEDRFHAILRIPNILRNHHKPRQAMKAMLGEISDLLNAERTTIYEIIDDDLIGIAVQGDLSIDVKISKGQGIAGMVASTAKSMNLKDAYLYPKFEKSFDQQTGFRTTSVLCVPMLNSQKECIGVIQVLNKKEGYFTKEDQVLLSALAIQAGMSLETLRLESELRAQNQHLQALSYQIEKRLNAQELLFQIEQSLGSAQDFIELSNQVLCKAANILNCQLVALLITEDQKEGIAYLRSPHCMSAVQVIPKVEIGEGILGKSASRTDVLNLQRDDLWQEGMPLHLCEGFDYPIENILSCPMRVDDVMLGTLVFVNRKVMALEHEDDEVQFAVLLSRQFARGIDQILKRKSAQQRDRLMTIGQMMSGVIHDLKGLMTSISGFSQLMVNMQNNEDRQNASYFIRRKIEEFNAMTREVMNFAKGDSAHITEKVFLNQFAQELLLTLKHEFDEHEMEFKVIWEDQKDVAYFNKVKMMRVVMNIARNARQAMTFAKGCFEWRIYRGVQNELVFEMKDNGPGIPDHIKNKVFDLFTTSGKKDGTGLGLAIVKKLVSDHHGKIELYSELGVGTTFIIRIPQIESNAPKAITFEND